MKEEIEIRILEKINALERYSKEIYIALPKDEEQYLKSNMFVKSTVERKLQLISDVEIDILALLYKHLSLKIVGDDFSLLGIFKGYLSDNVVEKMIRLRGIRNKLVHVYEDKKLDSEVFSAARENIDLKKLLKELKSLLKR